MLLIGMEAGTFFKSPRWSMDVVAELVAEPTVEYGLVRIVVYRRSPAHEAFPDALPATRARFATAKEMADAEWYVVARPSWLVGVGGSG